MTKKNKKLLLATLANASLYSLTTSTCAAAGQTVVEEDYYTQDGVTTEHSGDYGLVAGNFSGFDFTEKHRESPLL